MTLAMWWIWRLFAVACAVYWAWKFSWWVTGWILGTPTAEADEPVRYRLSYWLRPYDCHLDRRRWRWQPSGCHQSRAWWAEHGHRFKLPNDDAQEGT